MKKNAIIVVLTGLAATASAQRNLVDTRIRVAGETEWRDDMTLNMSYGEFVTVEVAVFLERASGYGLAGVIHDVRVSHWDPDQGDSVTLHDRPDSPLHPDGRQGRFNFGPQAQAAFVDGAFPRDLRISGAGDVKGSGPRIFERQENPVAAGTLFDTDTTVLGFRFDLTLTPRPGVSPTIHYLGTAVRYFAVFDTAQSTMPTTLDADEVQRDGATIVMFGVPAPSTVIVGAVALGFGWRRRR